MHSTPEHELPDMENWDQYILGTLSQDTVQDSTLINEVSATTHPMLESHSDYCTHNLLHTLRTHDCTTGMQEPHYALCDSQPHGIQ